MDLRMPRLDGYQATRQIRSESAAGPVVIALSASVFDEDEAIALESGCDGFLRKPIREHDLLEAIRQHLGVGYVYAESTVPAAPVPPGSPSIDAFSLDLTALPADWVQRLYEGAVVANSQALYALLDDLPPDRQSLALILRRWVQDFRCDKIVELVEQGRDATERESDHPDCG
jgi:hypothetical protein